MKMQSHEKTSFYPNLPTKRPLLTFIFNLLNNVKDEELLILHDQLEDSIGDTDYYQSIIEAISDIPYKKLRLNVIQAILEHVQNDFDEDHLKLFTYLFCLVEFDFAYSVSNITIDEIKEKLKDGP